MKLTTETLAGHLALLHQEFPDAKLIEVRVEVSVGERYGEIHGCARSWDDTSWRVQVNNDSERADSVEAAVTELRAKLAHKARVPSLAVQVAAILREIPDEGFAREDVIGAARALLDLERRGTG